MESHDETGCQTSDVPMPCINNCGFFGTAATMYMCSKCHKGMIMKEEQAKLAASSIGNLVTGSSSNADGKEPVVAGHVDLKAGPVKVKTVSTESSSYSFSSQSLEVKARDSPNRCSACQKRVGLTGFNCKCGNLFCALHRYSDRHDCPFDYRKAARDAIAKANPVVKAEKLDKI